MRISTVTSKVVLTLSLSKGEGGPQAATGLLEAAFSTVR
jgi:hypothetical protein